MAERGRLGHQIREWLEFGILIFGTIGAGLLVTRFVVVLISPGESLIGQGLSSFLAGGDNELFFSTVVSYATVIEIAPLVAIALAIFYFRVESDAPAYKASAVATGGASS